MENPGPTFSITVNGFLEINFRPLLTPFVITENTGTRMVLKMAKSEITRFLSKNQTCTLYPSPNRLRKGVIRDLHWEPRGVRVECSLCAEKNEGAKTNA